MQMKYRKLTALALWGVLLFAPLSALKSQTLEMPGRFSSALLQQEENSGGMAGRVAQRPDTTRRGMAQELIERIPVSQW